MHTSTLPAFFELSPKFGGGGVGLGGVGLGIEG